MKNRLRQLFTIVLNPLVILTIGLYFGYKTRLDKYNHLKEFGIYTIGYFSGVRGVANGGLILEYDYDVDDKK